MEGGYMLKYTNLNNPKYPHFHHTSFSFPLPFSSPSVISTMVQNHGTTIDFCSNYGNNSFHLTDLVNFLLISDPVLTDLVRL
ncbi:hypothetical protein Hanom_Chr09g00861121 [Helianthus anomalus]